MRYRRPVALILLTALGACHNPGRRAAGSPAASNPELERLFELDQAARSGPIESVDVEALARENGVQRARVRELASSGALRTAKDFYHAAMVFQHGADSTAYRQASQWARRSEELDSTDLAARWLVAASWDRYQMSRGEPQWFGTQTTRTGGAGPVLLYALDTTRVTDAERIHRRVGSLVELRARLDTLNRRMGFTAAAPAAPPTAPARAQAIAAAREIMQAVRYATLATIGDDGGPQARIVDPFAPEPDLAIWIATNPRTRKVSEIRRDGRVTLLYFDAAAGDYVTVLGTATLVADSAEKSRHWKKEWVKFYKDGPRGDGYLLIRVRPTRLEIVSPRRGLVNDPATWLPVVVEIP